MKNQYRILTQLALLVAGALATQATINVDLSPGTGSPPSTLGGYNMVPFPTDPSPEGTLTGSLTPPVSSPVVGDLTFGTPLEHMKAGSVWDTWSHGYTGDVYFTPDHDLRMTLPDGTLAFYLYVQPNLKYTFEFAADSEGTVATLDIDGNAGARYVGFYTDDPLDPLAWIRVTQTTSESDGFAVGEFGINSPVPEVSTWIAGLAALGILAYARRRS